MIASPTLKQTVVLVFSSISLLSTILFWNSTRNLDKGAEAIIRWETNLAPVKTTIPIQRGVIGYVAEWDIQGAEYEYWDQMAEYLLTQYTLAPLIVKQGAVAEWNVAVLPATSMQVWQQEHKGKFQVIPLKHNVYVLHKLEK